MHVGAVHRTAIDDVLAVDRPGRFLADVAELRSRLQPQAVPRRYRQGPGSGGQGAVAQFPPTGLVDHLVQLRPALRQRHLPLGRRRLLKHGSRSRAATPHGLVPMAHAARAIGVLVAITRLVTRRLPDLDQGPVGFQFVGHHHAQAGTHALAHFRAVAGDRYAAVGIDADIDLGIVDPAVGHAVGAELLVLGKGILPTPTGGQHQGTGGAHAFEKTPATQVGQGEISR